MWSFWKLFISFKFASNISAGQVALGMRSGLQRLAIIILENWLNKHADDLSSRRRGREGAKSPGRKPLP